MEERKYVAEIADLLRYVKDQFQQYSHRDRIGVEEYKGGYRQCQDSGYGIYRFAIPLRQSYFPEYSHMVTRCNFKLTEMTILEW